MSFFSLAQRLTRVTMERLGNVVEIAGTTGRGQLQSPTEELFDGMTLGVTYELRIPFQTFGEVPEGEGVTVDGVAYVARQDSRPDGDGTTEILLLEKVLDQQVPDVVDGDFTYVVDGDWDA